MKKVYICAPLGGDIQGNLEKAKRYTEYALKCGTAPVVPHFYALCLNDDIPSEREIGLSAGMSLLWFCDELWIFGDEITEGMRREIDFCERQRHQKSIRRIMHMKKKSLRIILSLALCVMVMTTFSVTAFAAGDVSGAIESTWNAAKSQVQTVVNNVVFPVIDMILAILFFVKVGTSYFEYRKHGQFEFAAPCILFACLIFTLTAPLYIWTIL